MKNNTLIPAGHYLCSAEIIDSKNEPAKKWSGTITFENDFSFADLRLGILKLSNFPNNDFFEVYITLFNRVNAI